MRQAASSPAICREWISHESPCRQAELVRIKFSLFFDVPRCVWEAETSRGTNEEGAGIIPSISHGKSTNRALPQCHPQSGILTLPHSSHVGKGGGPFYPGT